MEAELGKKWAYVGASEGSIWSTESLQLLGTQATESTYIGFESATLK